MPAFDRKAGRASSPLRSPVTPRRSPRRGDEAGETEGAATLSPVLDVLRTGGGRALDAGTRAYFESRLGRDFGGVRVHDDARADASAQSVRALAYTVGQDVVFRQGAFAPETASGKRLLAHELAHVVQQSGAPSWRAAPGALAVAPADTVSEREADRVADAAVGDRQGYFSHAGPARGHASSAPALMRKADDSGIAPDEMVLVDGTLIRSNDDAAAWYATRSEVLHEHWKAFTADKETPPESLAELGSAANLRSKKLKKLGSARVSDSEMTGLLGWLDVYANALAESDEQMERIAIRRIRETRQGLEAMLARQASLEPQLRELQRSAFRKSSRGTLQKISDVWGKWGNSAMIARDWIESAATTVDDITVLRARIRTTREMELFGSSTPLKELLAAKNAARVAKVMSLLGKLDKTVAVYQLFDASLAVITGGKTASDRASAGIGLAATVASAGGTLLGASSMFTLYNNFYVGPMVNKILGQIDQLKDMISTGRNRPYIELGHLDLVDWDLEPGGQDMYLFMRGVMQASSAADVKAIPGSVGKYFKKHRKDFDAGTPQRHGVDIDYDDLDDKRVWAFAFRDDIWGMLYGNLTKR